MQYNSNATNQDICSMADRLVKSNTVSFPLIDKTLYANEGCRFIQSWIHEAYGGWVYDDSNNTDFPEATTALVSGQQDYAVPTDTSLIQGFAIKQTDGTWYRLFPLTLERIEDIQAEPEFMKTNSTPRYYRISSGQVKLYPTPNYSQSASLKVFYTRDISGFITSDTTKTPGFDIQYHEAVPTYMALQYARINTLPSAKSLEEQWQRYEVRIKNDYSRKLAQLFPPRITVRDAVRDNQ